MRLIGLFLISMILTSCSHTYYLGSLSAEQTQSFHEKSASSKFNVHLADGTVVGGTALQAYGDSLAWRSAGSNEILHASAMDVEFIGFRNRVAGGVEGFMYGFILGAAAGGVAGYVVGEEDCSGSDLCFDKGGTAMIGAGVFGVSTALLGGVLGTLRGTQENYYIGRAP